jgi:hypothetical protein
MTKDSQLHVEARMDSQGLHLEVDYWNTSSEPVYLMTLLHDWYGILAPRDSPITPPPTQKLAFVSWKAPDWVLVVNGESAPPPDGVNPYAPRRPFGHRLLAGARFKNTLLLKLPLLEWHAYAKPKSVDTIPVAVHSLRYRLEIVPSSQATDQDEHASYPGAWQVIGPSFEQVVDVELPTTVTLLKRLDPKFKRFR